MSQAKASSKLSVYCSSAEDFDNMCDLCLIDGDHVHAVGLCITCGENMCKPCFKSHSKSKATKHHDLRDRSGMSQSARDMFNSTGHSMGAATGSDTFEDEYTFMHRFDVRTENDTMECYIVDMALLTDSKMAIVDIHNNSLKLLHTQKNTIIAQLSMESAPNGITAISGNELAATFSTDCRVKLISTCTGGLVVTRSFKVFSTCWGIAHRNGKLFVSFYNPLSFQILGISGAVRKTIKPDSKVEEKCKCPCFIAVHPDEESIYVSDWKEGVIIRVDMSGILLALYADDGMKRPGAVICSPYGSIYVSNEEQHVLYKMPADLSEAFVVLTELDDLEFPRAVCYNHDQKIFYISMSSLGCINMYKQK